MDNEEDNNSENVPVAYVFLPVCVESKCDVFLSVLRSIFARTKIDDLLHNSLITGMKVRKFQIEAEDKGSWKELTSQPQQVRQAMMLGFWAIQNFPSLGNRLCGETWKPPQRQFVEVVGRNSIMPDAFDTFIFGKMKLRIIELRGNQSTLQRLKSFVKAPVGINKTNRTQLSKKSKTMFSFDIDNDFERQCWDALRSGVFSCRSGVDHAEKSTDEAAQHLTSSNKESHPENDQRSLIAPINSYSDKRPHHDVSPDATTTTYALDHLTNDFHLDKRARLDVSTGDDTTTYVLDQLTNESLRTVLLQMQRGIGNLTKWLEPGNDELRKESDRLKSMNTSLSSEIESKDVLISALQKGTEANFKLYENSEIQLAALQESFDQQKQVIVTKDNDLEAAKTLVNILQTQLTSSNNDADTAVPQLNNQIELLEQKLAEYFGEVNEWKVYGVEKDKELAELSNRAETLRRKFAKSDKENGRLNEQLNERSAYGAAKEKELAEAKSGVAELSNRIGILEKKLTESAAENGTLNGLLNEWKTSVAEKDRELAEFSDRIETLTQKLAESNEENVSFNGRLKEWTAYGAAKERDLAEAKTGVAELSNRIGILEKKLVESAAENGTLNGLLNEWKASVAEKDNELAEFSDRIETLTQKLAESNEENVSFNGQLKQWTVYGAAKEKDLAEAKTGVAELSNRIGVLETKLAESAAENGTLNGLLEKWKAYGSAKDKELEEALMKFECVQENVNSINNDADSILSQMNVKIKILEKNISVLTARNEELDGQLNAWKVYGAGKDKEIEAVVMNVECVQEKLNVSDSNLPLMKNQVGMLDRNLKESTESVLTTVSKSYPCECEELNESETSNEDQLPDAAITALQLSEGLSTDNPKSNVTDDIDNSARIPEHRNESQIKEEVVRACRPILMKQRFGWIRFNSNKNCRAWPGFVYEPDADSFSRAQKVTLDGSVSSTKYRFHRYDENIPENDKGKQQLKALSKFNEEFHFTFV